MTLMNLLLMIGALAIALALVVTYFRKKDQDEEVKRKLGWRLASVVVAIAAIITFLLTEDMTAPRHPTLPIAKLLIGNSSRMLPEIVARRTNRI